MTLPQETIDKIKKEALNKYPLNGLYFSNEDHNRSVNRIKGYEAGATEWTEKAQGLVDALEMARREIVALYKTKGYSESFVTRTIDEALAKYKEVTNG